jgi:hypothetical protein
MASERLIRDAVSRLLQRLPFSDAAGYPLGAGDGATAGGQVRVDETGWLID